MTLSYFLLQVPAVGHRGVMSLLRVRTALRGLANSSESCRAVRSKPKFGSSALRSAGFSVGLAPVFGLQGVRIITASGCAAPPIRGAVCIACGGILKPNAQTMSHAVCALQKLQAPLPRTITLLVSAAGVALARPLSTRPPTSHSPTMRAYSSGCASSGRTRHSGGQQGGRGGGQNHQGSTFAFNFSGAHIVCYGAMLVVALPALGKTLVVMCEGKSAVPPARPVTAQPPADLNDNPPVTMADLFR